MEQHFVLFFLDEFHQGAFNHVTHFIGFALLGYGLGRRNWWLVILSPIIMEMGHVFNYFTGIHQEVAIKIIPLQWLAWIIFVGAGYLISRLFQRKI